MAIGAFPGSFNPITVAHLAIAESARERCQLERVDLIVSRIALAKEDVSRPRLEDRLAVLHAVASSRPWLGVRVTEDRLLVDIAAGYDVLILGADKWAQLHDPAWYGGSIAARDRALSRLCRVVVAPRPPHAAPDDQILPLAANHQQVSSSSVRLGRIEWMVAEAAEFDARTGAWTDPHRYERWLAGQTDA